jgi:hypothetical protein
VSVFLRRETRSQNFHFALAHFCQRLSRFSDTGQWRLRVVSGRSRHDLQTKISSVRAVATSAFYGGRLRFAAQPSQSDQRVRRCTYDSLTVAHGALTSLRGQVLISFPKYTAVFNQATAAYSTAYDAYATYRATAGNQADMAVALANLTTSVIALEDAFLSDLPVSAAASAGVHQKAAKMRAAQPKVSISDILTELEIAAALAEAIPAAQPYAALAELVIQAASQALAAEQMTSGQPINLAALAPVPAIA